MSDDARDDPIVSAQNNASQDSDAHASPDRPARSQPTARVRGGSGVASTSRSGQATPAVDVVMERRGRGYAVLVAGRMKPVGHDGDSFYRAVLLALGQTRGDEVTSHDIQAFRNDVADTLIPRLNSGLLRIWWQNRRKRTGLSPERYIERYIRSPGSWDEPLAQLLPVIVPSCATWRRLGGKRLMVDAPGHGKYADQGKPKPITAIRASDLWNDFVKSDAAVFPLMGHQVLRDRPLAISALARAASITLDHPRDAVEMRSVPPELTVVFNALAGDDTKDDQRNLVLLPSSVTLVNMHGSLPTIEMSHAVDSGTGTMTYTVTDTGNGATVRFVFAGEVACPAMQVLDVLRRAADGKQAAARQTLQSMMTGDSAQGGNSPVRRAAMARLWSDLSDEVRRRVLAGFAAREGLKAVELDVVRELKGGSEPARVALATDMLVAALGLWQNRGDIARIPFSFWLAEMAHEMPPTADWRDFVRARNQVLESFNLWQAVRADLESWLGEPLIAGDVALDTARRDCLVAALARADNATLTAPARLGSMPAREVRRRLADVRHEILQQRQQTRRDVPERVSAALARCASDVCGITDGEMSDDPRAPPAVPPVSVLWPPLAADTTRDVLRLDGRAHRDSPLDLSLVRRRATLVLDHSSDIVQMRDIPPDLTVRFEPAAPGAAGSDQRWLIILPGWSDFLGQYGSLPSINISEATGAHPGWKVITIFDIGRRVGCRFIFAGNVAPRVKSVLDSLKQVADGKWTTFTELYAMARETTNVVNWGTQSRNEAAAYWRAFPVLVKSRVLDYFRIFGLASSLLQDADIADVLANGTGTARLALARKVLVSAMSYWDEHGELDDIEPTFWDDAARREMASEDLSPATFDDMLEQTLQQYRQWEDTRPLFGDLLLWLGQSVLEDEPDAEKVRRCLRRATQRAAGLVVDDDGSDCLAQSTSQQIRARLARTRKALVAAAPQPAMPARILPHLLPWLAYINGAEPLLLDESISVTINDVIDNASPSGIGVSGVSYLLDAGLPAHSVADRFAFDATPLADGSLALEKLGQYDGDDAEGQRWWRKYALTGAWTYHPVLRSWHRTQHEMNVEGTVTAQRGAFDTHMDNLLRDMGNTQSFNMFSQDKRDIRLAGNATRVLAPHSAFAKRTVRLVGDGGSLTLPDGLRGEVTIDLSALGKNAPARIEVGPRLLARMEPKRAVSVEGKTFMCYVHDDDDALTVLVGPQESGHPLGLTLAAQVRRAARKRLRYDLADEGKLIILVSPAVDDEFVLPPMKRDVLICPRGKVQKFTISQIGPARLQLMSGVPADETAAELSLRLRMAPELLPRYGLSDVVLGNTGYVTGAIRDSRSNGMVLFSCSPGVRLDRATWSADTAPFKRAHDTYVDHLFDWDDRLVSGLPFSATDLDIVRKYGHALVERADVTLLQRSAILSSALNVRQEVEHAGNAVKAVPGRADSTTADDRRTVSAVLAQLLTFSFSHAFVGVDEAQWTRLANAGHSLSMARRLTGMYIDMAWQREQADEFYAGLAGLYRFLQMSTGDAQVEAALARDEACIYAALDLIAGEPVDDASLRDAGLERIKDAQDHLLQLKLILVTHLDARVFDDDALWRDRLLRDLRRTHVRSRRGGVLDLLASALTGHGGRDAVLLAYQHRKLATAASPARSFDDNIPKDVVLFEQIATLQRRQTLSSGNVHRLDQVLKKQPQAADCRLVSAVNFSGALLIFIGDIGTVVGKWYINEPTAPAQRLATMYFQIVKAAGWAVQHTTGFYCQPEADGATRFIQLTAPVVGLGMGFNYLLGGLGEMVVRSPRTRWTWRQDMRPLIARMPGVRAYKAMQLIDTAGNIYLILAEGAKIAALSGQIERPQGSDVLSVTAFCSSAVLGTIAAAGEIGTKALLTPAKRFYQAVGLSSATLNLCGASTPVIASSTLRADDTRQEF